MKAVKLFLMSITVAMLAASAGYGRTLLHTGNDKQDKNTPTHSVTVADVITQNEMPRELRSDRTSQKVENSLSINKFNIANVSEGKYSLGFDLVKSGTAYIRIVDNGGYDVYFETYKAGTTYNKQIDLSLLPAGTYFFQVTQGGKTFTKKLIFS